MDRILEGVFTSSHSRELKLELIERIINSIPAMEDQPSLEKMIKFCALTIVNKGEDFEGTITKRILNALTRSHPSPVANFFSKELNIAVQNGLFAGDDGSMEKKGLLEVLAQVISVIRSTSKENDSLQDIMIRMVSCFLEEKCDSICAMLAEILIQNWNEDTIRSMERDLITKIIHLLQSFSLKINPTDDESAVTAITRKVFTVNLISSLFSKVIQIDEKFVHFALSEIFNVLCQDQIPSSVTLAPLLTSIPHEYAIFAADSVCSNKLIADEVIELVLCKLIDWLAWPASQKLDNWIIILCNSLLTDKRRHKLVAGIIKKKAVVVFNHMFCEVSRESALSVFSYMMLLYQHSPGVFHEVAPRITGLFSLMENSTNPNRQILKTLADLIYTLVFMFPGYSDIYSTLLPILKKYPKPSVTKMREWLTKGLIVQSDDAAFKSQLCQIKKEIQGMTGLNNLGNTCYMNSVIQALFMLKSFRSRLLSPALTFIGNSVTASMAKLFAFLLLSERPSISPTDFWRLSRPPWFRPGAQQDCSEFLKYVIDKLEQESKSRQQHTMAGEDVAESGIHEWFTGECKVDVKCMNCGFVSSRFEAFTDIPLAFPDAVNNQARTFPLKGGDISRGIVNRVKEEKIAGNETKDALEANQVRDLGQSNSQPSHHLNELNPTETSTKYREHPLNFNELLHSYLKTEVLSGQNQYRCDNCASLQDAEKRHYFTTCPKYFIFTLKRFTYDVKTQRRGKIMQNVQFPYDLTVPVLFNSTKEQRTDSTSTSQQLAVDDCSMDCESTLSQDQDHDVLVRPLDTRKAGIASKPVLKVIHEEQKTYTLVAVIVHAGVSSESGHYYCYCRNSASRKVVEKLSSEVSDGLTCLDNRIAEDEQEEKTDALSVQKIGVVSSDEKCEDASLKSEWYLFNDSLVSRVDASNLEKIQTDHPRDTPYVFIYEESCPDLSNSYDDRTKDELVALVESDNREYQKDNRTAKRPSVDSLWQSKSRKWKDDDKDDGNGGGGSYGNCGGSLDSFSSNMNRFIY